jgi:hypothetical protein
MFSLRKNLKGIKFCVKKFRRIFPKKSEKRKISHSDFTDDLIDYDNREAKKKSRFFHWSKIKSLAGGSTNPANKIANLKSSDPPAGDSTYLTTQNDFLSQKNGVQGPQSCRIDQQVIQSIQLTKSLI